MVPNYLALSPRRARALGKRASLTPADPGLMVRVQTRASEGHSSDRCYQIRENWVLNHLQGQAELKPFVLGSGRLVGGD